jgi:hypothetical protein
VWSGPGHRHPFRAQRHGRGSNRAILVSQPTLSDDDISAHLLADESLQERASKYGVKLMELNVSTSNLTEPAQLAHAFKQAGIVLEGTPDAVLAARTVNRASAPAALTALDSDAPAA